jgi:nucleoside-diphosphate-sugar epimerase
MKIFMTGATGVIGRRAVPLLIQRGHRVTAVTRSRAKGDEIAKTGAQPLELDLYDLDKVRAAVRGHDTIINLATSIPPSSRALLPWAWRETAKIRRYVSANLAAAARGSDVGRIVQESFAPIYASNGEQLITETSRVKPSRYNRTALDAERAATEFGARDGVGVVLRFAVFYGPDSDFTLDTIRMVRKGWAPVLGSPEAYISSVSHDDAASAVVSAVTTPGGIYNVVDDEPLKKRDFYYSLARALKVDPPKFPPGFLSHLLGSVAEMLSRSQRISNAKLRAAGWAPRYRSARDAWSALVRITNAR